MSYNDHMSRIDDELANLEGKSKPDKDEEIEKIRKLFLEQRIHSYICGRVGTGKSRLLWWLINEDLKDKNRSIVVWDCKEGLYHDVLAHVRGNLGWNNDQMRERVILLDLNQFQYTPTINMLQIETESNPISRALKTSKKVGSMIDSLEAYFSKKSIGHKIEQTLKSGLALTTFNERLAVDLLEIINPYDEDKELLHELLKNPELPDRIKRFWKEFLSFSPSQQADFTATTYTKISPFNLVPAIEHAFCCPVSSVDLRKELNTPSKLILVNLNLGSKTLNNQELKLVGALIFNQMVQVLKERVETDNLVPLSIYCDEFYKYITKDFADVANLLRSRKVNLTLAHQNFEQMEGNTKLLEGIIDECDIMAVMRVGNKTASNLVEKLFYPYKASYSSGRLSNEASKAKGTTKLMKLDNRECYLAKRNQEAIKIKRTPDIFEPENKRMIIKELFANVFRPEKGYRYFLSREAIEEKINACRGSSGKGKNTSKEDKGNKESKEEIREVKLDLGGVNGNGLKEQFKKKKARRQKGSEKEL